MNVERRQVLRYLALSAWALIGSASDKIQSHTEINTPLLCSAVTLANGTFAAIALDWDRAVSRLYPLPFQGHGLVALGADTLAVLARRPATLAALIQLSSGHTTLFHSGANRHFNGHGCLNEEGSVLFTSENDYVGVRGVIGIRDSQTGRLLGEYDSGGLDPHDIRLMPDGKTLVIANGGIQTHPDFGRRKLNIATMQPSLVYLDSTDGKRLSEYRLPNHQLSIRHLTVTPSGDVGVALQYEGELIRQPPEALVAWQAYGGDLVPLVTVPEQLAVFQGYMGDVMYDARQKQLLATSLRGQALGIWDIPTQTFQHSVAFAEPNGIALHPNGGVMVSSATGAIGHLRNLQLGIQTLAPSIQWDNHLLVHG